MNLIKITLISFVLAMSGIKVSQAQNVPCSYKQYSKDIISEARRNISQSESRIRQNSQDFPAYLQLARSLSTLCQTEKSLEQYKYVTNFSDDPQLLAEAYIGMGYVWYRQNELEKALLAFNSAIQSVNEEGDLAANAYMGIGQTLEKQNKREEAILAYRKSLAIRESDTRMSSYFELISALRKQGRFEEAIQIYKQELNKTPDDWSALHNYANLLFRLGRYSEVESLFKEQISRNPKSSKYVDSYMRLGHVLFRQGKHTAAFEAYKTGVALFQPGGTDKCVPGELSLFQPTFHSELLVNHGFYDLAILLCRKEEVTFPEGASHANYIGEILLKQKKYQEAIEEFKRAIEIKPSNQKAIYNLKATELLLEKLQQN